MPELSIFDEVETAISVGSAEKRLETIRRVTDLFLASAGSFNAEQIELFDDVLQRLMTTIELRAIADVSARIALAEISQQLAPIAQAPPGVVRRLARNDEITIAGPVLTESARLGPEELVELAHIKGELHLLAIAGRWWLKEVVTDALLARRYPSVSRRIAHNPGARLSAGGFALHRRAGCIRSRTRRRGRDPDRFAVAAPPAAVAQRHRCGPGPAVVTRAAASVR